MKLATPENTALAALALLAAGCAEPEGLKPALMVGVSRYLQTGWIDWALPESVVVRVTDAFGFPVPGASVSWDVLVGGGRATTPTLTDTAGVARTEWVVGRRLDTLQVLRASVEGVSPLIFAAKPRLFPTQGSIAVTTAPQTAYRVYADTSPPLVFPDSVEAVVRFTDGTPVQGALVTWKGNGIASPETTRTDSQGHARAAWAADRPGWWLIRADVDSLLGPDTAYGNWLVGDSSGLVATSGKASHGCAITSLGRTYCWGNGGSWPARRAVSDTFIALAVGSLHACGLHADGQAFCWGSNADLQLGNPDVTYDEFNAHPVAGGIAFTALTAGAKHTCGLVASGAAYCWGRNTGGWLGDGTLEDRATPVAVAGGLAFTEIVAGFEHTCGLTAHGLAYCWGSGALGQLGDSTYLDREVPTLVAGGHRFTTLAAGEYFTCGATTGGTLCWGSAQFLGASSGSYNYPVPAGGDQVFVRLSAGQEHVCGLTDRGRPYCWGRDWWINNTVAQPFGAGIAFSAITSGSGHACGITAAGDGYCWGSNPAGQIGDGTLSGRGGPQQIWFVPE